MVMANRIAVSYSVTALAIRGGLFRTASFAFMPCMGLGQGALPLIGYNFGAKEKERVGQVVVKAGFAAFVWGLFCWAVASLFSTQVMSIFNSDTEFIAEGSVALRIFSVAFVTIGVQMIITFFFLPVINR